MKNFKWVFVLCFGSLLFSCKTSQPPLTQENQNYINSHKKVAVLPFYVTFSEDYKLLLQRTGTGQNNMRELERVAGLDLQKNCFLETSKRAAKKNLGILVQDFLTTNKILESKNIRFSDLKNANKNALARILDVDAVIWGESNTVYNLNSFGNRNGISTKMYIFDADSPQNLWQNETFQNLNSRMDTPQSLAKSSVYELVRSLPYLPLAK